jgi:hypothetical protein
VFCDGFWYFIFCGVYIGFYFFGVFCNFLVFFGGEGIYFFSVVVDDV